MRRFLIFSCVFFFSAYCFSQQNLPSKIIGRMPDPNSTALYQIQVGAYLSAQNTVDISGKLRSGGFNPVSEIHQDLTRIMIKGIPAGRLISDLERVKRLGFDEVIVREEKSGYTVPENRNVNVPPNVYPAPAVIHVNDIGKIKIRKADGTEIEISFSGAPQASNPFYREWRVVKCTNEAYIGDTYRFSVDGTFLVTKSDGNSHLARWRWRDNNHEEWEYSHHNWESYGRVKINTLNQELLVFTSPNYFASVDGYSSADQDDVYELVPIRR